MLVIEVVDILWTKASRGAPRANARAALPRAFGLAGDRGPCLIQRHRMVEWQGFAPELVQLECSTAVPSSVEVLRLQAVGSDAMVLVSWGRLITASHRVWPFWKRCDCCPASGRESA